MTNTSETKRALVDFFWVYYGPKVSRDIDRHPDRAIPLLREALESGISPVGRLSAYARALSAAVSLQSVGTPER